MKNITFDELLVDIINVVAQLPEDLDMYDCIQSAVSQEIVKLNDDALRTVGREAEQRYPGFISAEAPVWRSKLKAEEYFTSTTWQDVATQDALYGGRPFILEAHLTELAFWVIFALWESTLD